MTCPKSWRLHDAALCICVALLTLVPTVTYGANVKPVKEAFEGVFVDRQSLLHLTPGLISDKVRWRWVELPDVVARALPKAMRDENGMYCIEQHDLDADGRHEYLVFDRMDKVNPTMTHYGSGYAILQEQKGRWKQIGWIYGGFNITLHSRVKGEYSEIETWWHDTPNIRHSFWQYSKGRYRLTWSSEWPKEFRTPGPWQIPFDEGQKEGCQLI